MVIGFLRSVRCFISVITFIDLPVPPPSVSSGSVISLIFCCREYSNLQTSATCLFLQYWHVNSWAGLLWLGFQFGAMQYLQVLSFGLSFGLVPTLPL